MSLWSFGSGDCPPTGVMGTDLSGWATCLRPRVEPLYPDWQLDERLKKVDREEEWRRQWIHAKSVRPKNIKTPQSLKRRCFFMRDRLVFRFEG